MSTTKDCQYMIHILFHPGSDWSLGSLYHCLYLYIPCVYRQCTSKSLPPQIKDSKTVNLLTKHVKRVLLHHVSTCIRYIDG